MSSRMKKQIMACSFGPRGVDNTKSHVNTSTRSVCGSLDGFSDWVRLRQYAVLFVETSCPTTRQCQRQSYVSTCYVPLRGVVGKNSYHVRRKTRRSKRRKRRKRRRDRRRTQQKHRIKIQKLRSHWALVWHIDLHFQPSRQQWVGGPLECNQVK